MVVGRIAEDEAGFVFNLAEGILQAGGRDIIRGRTWCIKGDGGAEEQSEVDAEYRRTMVERRLRLACRLKMEGKEEALWRLWEVDVQRQKEQQQQQQQITNDYNDAVRWPLDWTDVRRARCLVGQ